MDKSRIEAFVTSNSDYYLNKWTSAETKPSYQINVAAFFLSMFWLIYRKLYLQLGILILVIVADVSITSFLESNNILATEIIAIWDRISVFVYGAIVGVCGNRWYYASFMKANEIANKQFNDEHDRLNYLSTRGGTNAVGTASALLALVVIVFTIFTYG